MGFKDANWAYRLRLPTAQKVVLVAIAHSTDDKTHQTYVSQKTVASMVELSTSTVNAAVKELVRKRVISKTRRNGAGGYRTTDLITVERSYIGETNIGESNIGETNVGVTADLLPDDGGPTSESRIAEEINQIDQPEDQPVSSATPRRSTTGTRLIEGWMPSPAVREQMALEAPLVDLRKEHERFTDYWIGVPGARGRKANWDATWRNWIRKANEDASRRQNKLTPEDRMRATIALGADFSMKELAS
ncbi:helix-turn-helix domain-containing protein [Diaminobutyricimonas sp. LJ205]|uniref:helix-turn-helix domain-containing protein n=1 Tax=Diaminobutyricimonas sp. LJ205 TaxID=2683590 RepID=UPI0012F51E11|nr:helix-turn-helix domain-containing protein [Diaminobutyricimonas sp. LJ205]